MLKRLGLVVILTVGLVGGTMFAVNASGGDEVRISDVEASRSSLHLAMHKFRVLTSVARRPCVLGQGTIEGLTHTVQCINNKLEKLDVLSRRFFQCATLKRITQYGKADGSFGYSFTPDGGAAFLTTGLDFTENPTTDSWDWAVLWKKSCGSR